MKILSLNIRGFGCDENLDGKINWFRSLRISEQPDIVVIQESKCHEVSNKWIRRIWGNSDFDFIQKPMIGRSGGMLIIWDPNIFKVNHAVVQDFFIAIKGVWFGKEKETIIVNVYGPHNDEDKKKLWCSLDSIMKYPNVSWVIYGDFNEVRHPSERENCEYIDRRAKRFNEFINNN
ncbi:uncharacterized protein [Rutidosis leptorrhynchoides]|uniref:uncharacterized protein n=1 Tax=Rutidosis leptorrhynchoides TaxID=125765 RepID=UPI003A98D885